MKRKPSSNFLFFGVLVVVLVAGTLAYLFSQEGSEGSPGATETLPAPVLELANIPLTPPESLSQLSAEVATDYPQLAELLDNPELGSVYKDFYITYRNAGPEAALALAQQRGILNENGDVVLTLLLDTTEQTAALIS